MTSPIAAAPGRPPQAAATSRPRPGLVLAAFVVGTQAAGAIGVPFTETDPGSWYDRLDKAPFNPPGSVFGPTWIVLYVAVAVAGWLLWRAAESPARDRALTLWFVQLCLNAIWTPLFFGAQRPRWSLIDLLALSTVAATLAVTAWRVDRRATWLLVPYLAWLAFAATLNAWIVAVN